jgi:hypothetical protein
MAWGEYQAIRDALGMGMRMPAALDELRAPPEQFIIRINHLAPAATTRDARATSGGSGEQLHRWLNPCRPADPAGPTVGGGLSLITRIRRRR